MGNDLQTVLLLKSAFLYVFRFFRLVIILSCLASFLPFFEVIPEILCNYNFSLSVFNPSGIRRKYIANVSFLFADVPISSGCAGGRPQSMPCACPTVGWKACPTARASGPGPEWGLRLQCGGTGCGASSRASRETVSAFRRCRSTTRGHVRGRCPQCV